jgi:hypothetical protein
MKKITLLIIVIMMSFVSYAQVFVNDVDINKLEGVKYVELLGTSKFLSTKLVVSVDYGQEQKLFKSQRIKDDSGKTQDFNSIIDALNFMELNGWEFVNNYTVTVGQQNVYHYLLRKKSQK